MQVDRLQQGVVLALGRLGLLACTVVRCNKEVADDRFIGVAQCRDRDHDGEAAAVLADASQFVDVFDAVGGFEDQRIKPRSNRRRQLDAQGLGPSDEFCRV